MQNQGEVHFPLCVECGKEIVPTKNKKKVKMTLSRMVGTQKVITEHMFCDWTDMIKWSAKQKDHFGCQINRE